MTGKALAVTLVAAIAAAGFVKHEDRLREQNRLARVASALAGRPVGVRCPGFLSGLVDVHGDAGRVRFDANGRPAGYTDLSPDTCRALRRLPHTDFSCLQHDACGYTAFDAAWAAHALAHEAFHLRGYEDEAVAECYAMQDTAFVAERLGVKPPCRAGAAAVGVGEGLPQRAGRVPLAGMPPRRRARSHAADPQVAVSPYLTVVGIVILPATICCRILSTCSISDLGTRGLIVPRLTPLSLSP